MYNYIRQTKIKKSNSLNDYKIKLQILADKRMKIIKQFISNLENKKIADIKKHLGEDL